MANRCRSVDGDGMDFRLAAGTIQDRGMSRARLLIANRGEIAVRIARSAVAAGIAPVLVHSEDDRQAPHLRAPGALVAVPGTGAASYLDIAALVHAASANDCDSAGGS